MTPQILSWRWKDAAFKLRENDAENRVEQK